MYSLYFYENGVTTIIFEFDQFWVKNHTLKRHHEMGNAPSDMWFTHKQQKMHFISTGKYFLLFFVVFCVFSKVSGVLASSPSPGPPKGCFFHPRCMYAQSRCGIEAPILESLGNQHYSACHFSGRFCSK